LYIENSDSFCEITKNIFKSNVIEINGKYQYLFENWNVEDLYVPAGTEPAEVLGKQKK
jgi:hypothetical protein